MQKKECDEANENNTLIMSDEKCKNCEYYYECRYMHEEMMDVMYGGF